MMGNDSNGRLVRFGLIVSIVLNGLFLFGIVSDFGEAKSNISAEISRNKQAVNLIKEKTDKFDRELDGKSKEIEELKIVDAELRTEMGGFKTQLNRIEKKLDRLIEGKNNE